MRLSPQQMFMPLLIIFSLTSGAVIILHYLTKKDEEKKGTKKRKINQSSVELKIPHQKVPMIIGRGGLVLDKIQESTDTNINFEIESDINLPDRVCVITGSPKNIKLAKDEILRILKNEPLIETYEILVPVRTINKLLERGGELLTHIQNSSNAKIILEQLTFSTDTNAERRMIIKGTAEQIANAMLIVEDKIREDKKLRSENESDSFTRLPRMNTPPFTPKKDIPKDDILSRELFGSGDIEGLMEVYVSAVVSPDEFYIQVIGNSNGVLDKLVKDMSRYYELAENRGEHRLKSIELGQIVAAKFSVDDQWYRAEVGENLGNDNWSVHFIDYGDQAKVHKSNIFELRTDFLSIRMQAIECSLAGIKPKEGEWSDEANRTFAELCQAANWQIRIAKIRRYKERILDTTQSRREGASIPCIELYEKTEDHKLRNIGKELVQMGYAVVSEEPWSASSSTLSVRATASPEGNLDHSNNSSGSSSTTGFVKVDHGDTASAMTTPEPKFPINPMTVHKPALQFSSGSFLENERNNPSNPRNPSTNKPLPPNPFEEVAKSKYEKQNIRVVPAGYEDSDSDIDDDYDGFDYA